MSIIDELEQRNILDNVTNLAKFNKLLANESVYIGFDPSAISLHLGNYIQIKILKLFFKYGFKPIAVLGGATGMIGDPSGKKSERKLLDQKTLLKNKLFIKKQFENFNFQVVDNYDFYQKMSIFTFLRDVGKLLNINYMLNKEMIKNRLDTGISFTEFTYQLIQGWDFKTLYEKYNVRIQIGGSDQWGNITSGLEIIKKFFGKNHQAVGLTTKLLTDANGNKIGKSDNKALFLDPEKTHPFVISQYLINLSDNDAKKMYKWVSTEQDLKDVKNKIAKWEQVKFKKKRLIHLELINLIFQDLYSKNKKWSKITDKCYHIIMLLFTQKKYDQFTKDDLQILSAFLPTINCKEINIIDALIKLKIVGSRNEARTLIKSKGLKIQGVIIDDFNFIIKPILNNDYSLLQKGKKHFYLIKH